MVSCVQLSCGELVCSNYTTKYYVHQRIGTHFTTHETQKQTKQCFDCFYILILPQTTVSIEQLSR